MKNQGQKNSDKDNLVCPFCDSKVKDISKLSLKRIEENYRKIVGGLTKPIKVSK